MASVGKPRSYMIQSSLSWSVVLKAEHDQKDLQKKNNRQQQHTRFGHQKFLPKSIPNLLEPLASLVP
eukprot:1156632-Pelagomonas_calceolata.AAC.1